MNGRGNLLLAVVALMLAVAQMTARGAAVQVDASARALEIRGAGADERFGRPIVCADINGDGYEDIFVGADRSIFSGGQRPTLFVFRGSPTFATRDLIELTTDTADAVILGDTGSNNFANALAAGDVNGDGIADLIAVDSSLTVSGRTGAGAVFVLFGRTNFFSQPTYDLALGDWSVKLLGASAFDDTGGYNLFGGLVSRGVAAGDLNNDGMDDIAVGAHLATANSRSQSGKVSVVYGRNPFAAGTTIDLASQASSTILGNETGAEMGTDLAIGDINADGIKDLIIGEEYGSRTTFSTDGRIFVIYGAGSFPSSVNLLTQAAGLTITGAHSWDSLGSAVAVADANGDGKGDLIATVSGWDHANSTSIDEGAVYGFFGKSTFPASLDLLSATPDFLVEGYNSSNAIGRTLVSGDFNGDGVGDFLFASRDGGRGGFSGEGRTYLVLGRTGLPSSFSVQSENMDYIFNGSVAGFQLGDWLGAGDLDGDGADEILIAAPFVFSTTGRLLVFDLNPVVAASPTWALYE
ncbi:MAG: VCBS repeat-containing protein [bacterium]